MALGRPVVVTDSVGVRDYIDHGVNGFVVPPEDPDGLAATVNALLADSAMAERVGVAAKRDVEQGFTGRHYTQRIRQLASAIVEDGC
jgi:rhamnosyl/mannosyltransferase